MKCTKTTRLLVDVLLVVILIGILTRMAVPEFGGECNPHDLKLSNLTTNLQLIRAQLELYKKHHGAYPMNITAQMTKKIDADGTINTAGEYGPYVQQFPANPFIDDPAQAIKTSGADGEGWSYDSATGTFAANTAGHEGLAVPGGEQSSR